MPEVGGSIPPAPTTRTVHEIAAISGHKSLAEVQRYTAAVNQAQLAEAAIAHLTGKR